MSDQEILMHIMEDAQNYPKIFNDVSRVLYRTYDRPMGASLCLICAYVIKQLEEEGKISYEIDA